MKITIIPYLNTGSTCMLRPLRTEVENSSKLWGRTLEATEEIAFDTRITFLHRHFKSLKRHLSYHFLRKWTTYPLPGIAADSAVRGYKCIKVCAQTWLLGKFRLRNYTGRGGCTVAGLDGSLDIPRLCRLGIRGGSGRVLFSLPGVASLYHLILLFILSNFVSNRHIPI